MPHVTSCARAVKSLALWRESSSTEESNEQIKQQKQSLKLVLASVTANPLESVGLRNA